MNPCHSLPGKSPPSCHPGHPPPSLCPTSLAASHSILCTCSPAFRLSRNRPNPSHLEAFASTLTTAENTLPFFLSCLLIFLSQLKDHPSDGASWGHPMPSWSQCFTSLHLFPCYSQTSALRQYCVSVPLSLFFSPIKSEFHKNRDHGCLTHSHIPSSWPGAGCVQGPQ